MLVSLAAPAFCSSRFAVHVVPVPGTAHFAKLFDIQGMVPTGGWEPTVGEHEALFERAGMELTGHHYGA